MNNYIIEVAIRMAGQGETIFYRRNGALPITHPKRYNEKNYDPTPASHRRIRELCESLINRGQADVRLEGAWLIVGPRE